MMLVPRDGTYKNFEECFAESFADKEFSAADKADMKRKWESWVIQDCHTRQLNITEVQYDNRRIIVIYEKNMKMCMDSMCSDWRAEHLSVKHNLECIQDYGTVDVLYEIT
jgi:Sec7-like guanine-nucleotide exchange factor